MPNSITAPGVNAAFYRTLRYMAQANALIDPDAAAGRDKFQLPACQRCFFVGPVRSRFSRTAVEHGRARVESLGRLRIAHRWLWPRGSMCLFPLPRHMTTPRRFRDTGLSPLPALKSGQYKNRAPVRIAMLQYGTSIYGRPTEWISGKRISRRSLDSRTSASHAVRLQRVVIGGRETLTPFAAPTVHHLLRRKATAEGLRRQPETGCWKC